MVKRFIFFMVLIVGMLVFICRGDINITKVGEWGSGEYNDVFLAGNYAYCTASGSGLDIIDISNPATPQPVGKFASPGGAVGIDVSNSYAYLVNGEGAFEVIDITNPSCPIRVGTADIKAVYPRSWDPGGKSEGERELRLCMQYD